MDRKTDRKTLLKVKAYMERYSMTAPGDTIAVGISGGADSVCLFLILCELAEELELRLLGVHVNHGIREEACLDAAYAGKLCEERGVPFFLVEEDVKAVARREGLSEEEAGRLVRYRAFEEALAKTAEEDGRKHRTGSGGSCGKIAVAHNANDRAETMLFHLFRGTGLKGAGGIRPVRDNVIRPILCLERGEIEAYLEEKRISFCIDRTNLEDTYTRNRIRNHILPFAEKEVCRGAVSHMCETADMLMEAERYIGKQTDKSYQACLVAAGERQIVLDAVCLGKEEAFLRRQILLRALELLTESRRDITSVHVKAAEGLLDKTGSRQISLPYGLTVKKEYDRLILDREGNRNSMSTADRNSMSTADRGSMSTADRNSMSTAKRDSTADTPVIAVPELPAYDIPAGHPVLVQVPGLGSVEFALLPGENNSRFIPEKTYTKWFDYDRITKSLVFRTRETGDYLSINKNFSRKSLKDYMIGEKIPKNQRADLYVLAEGSHILWVPGHRISEYYKISKDTKRILQVQLRGGL